MRELKSPFDDKLHQRPDPKKAASRGEDDLRTKMPDRLHPPQLLNAHPFTTQDFPFFMAVLCGPFMGQGASYAPLLGPR